MFLALQSTEHMLQKVTTTILLYSHISNYLLKRASKGSVIAVVFSLFTQFLFLYSLQKVQEWNHSQD